jgi:hypothetical protein
MKPPIDNDPAAPNCTNRRRVNSVERKSLGIVELTRSG